MFFSFIPGHWAKTAIYLPIGTFRGGKFFLRNFSLFFNLVHYAKKLGLLAVFLGKPSKLHSKFAKFNSEEKCSVEKKIVFSFFFGHWVEYCLKYVEKFWARISKLHSLFSKGSVGQKLVFSNSMNFLFKLFVILSENCSRNVFYEDNFLSIFGQWAKVYRFLSIFFPHGC